MVTCRLSPRLSHAQAPRRAAGLIGAHAPTGKTTFQQPVPRSWLTMFHWMLLRATGNSCCVWCLSPREAMTARGFEPLVPPEYGQSLGSIALATFTLVSRTHFWMRSLLWSLATTWAATMRPAAMFLRMDMDLSGVRYPSPLWVIAEPGVRIQACRFYGLSSCNR